LSAYDVLLKHGVTRLCHFTKLQSLSYILESPNGIMATSRIERDMLNQVDEVRADGELDYVCCSIEYPNSWYLDNAKKRNNDEIFRDWAIICINPEIVKIREVKVCECNAAKNYGMYIREGEEEYIEHLFANKVNSFRHPRTDRMIDACPTNSQTEILIKDGIPREYINSIIVGNDETARLVYAMRKTLGVDSIQIFISPNVVTTTWRQMIQDGIRPQECEYMG
jgi:hypothetical protein